MPTGRLISAWSHPQWQQLQQGQQLPQPGLGSRLNAVKGSGVQLALTLMQQS
jgi:hypothetical protein